MKLAYVTAQTPYGPGEAFILPEVIELQRRGHDVTVFPLRPGRTLAQGNEPAEVGKFTGYIPLLSLGVLVRATKLAAARPRLTARVVRDVLRSSGSGGKILKNLVVVPKGLVLGEEIKNRGVEHIHAHWASTPSTAAYIASLYSQVPWSFTAHRWDIAEGNMLQEKAATSKFVRAIDVRGSEEMKLQLGGPLRDKVVVVHVGVNLLSIDGAGKAPISATVACIANLVPKKGHEYLIEAASILKQRGLNVKYVLFGDGPLRQQLAELINRLDLAGEIEFRGAVPHDELLALLISGAISLVVLPSIETPDGEKEGIPVALMEAMAAGLPVISTTTGGIPELLGEGAGILVPPQDGEALAEAIERLVKDPELQYKIGAKGKEKVEKEFAISSVVGKMVELFTQDSEGKV